MIRDMGLIGIGLFLAFLWWCWIESRTVEHWNKP
jgi:hypothetical protein